MFIISDDNYIQGYDEKTFQMKGEQLNLPMSISDTEEPIEILNFRISFREKFIAVLAGKNLIKQIEEMYELFVYEVREDGDMFTLYRHIKLRKEFQYYSMSFEFDKNDEEEHNLIMVNKNQMVRYNYMTDQVTVLFEFKNTLDSQPDFFSFSEDQKIAIIASSDNALWININTKQEIDVDEEF